MRLRIAAVLVACAVGPLQAQTSTSYEELQRFSAVLNHIRANYADSVSYAELVRAAIDGMLRSLDPHSWFASQPDYERLNALERGELAETGIRFEMVEGVPTVVTYVSGSPAEKAGILPGDRIRRIAGVPAAGLPLKSVELRLAGDKGSKVELLLERGPRLEPDTVTVTIKRAFLKGRSVSDARMVDDRTGYVRLDEFSLKSAADLRGAVDKLRDQRARQLILDLRGNPGGIIDEAVDIAADFFRDDVVVFSTKGRRKVVSKEYRAKGGGRFASLPLIVLIDEHSASASELLAGAFQDNDRALIVGRRSFGKALMQTGFLVPEGYVQLTVAHVLSPSGRYIQRRYRGLELQEYYASAGTSTAEADTTTVYRTLRGREVRGGGGIAPDVAVPAPPSLPTWWSVASDSAFDTAVTDSVAATLSPDAAARQAWLSAPQRWQAELLPPFLARVRSRLHVAATPDSATAARLARGLAMRVAFVRWPPDGGFELRLRHDTDVQAALPLFARLPEMLKGGS